MDRHEVTESPAGRWTRPDDYLGAMARKRSSRRARRGRDRTEPESARLLLSTIPYLTLISLIGVLAVGIMVTDYPGSQPVARPPQPQPHEQGVAQKGWLQEAQRDFHR